MTEALYEREPYQKTCEAVISVVDTDANWFGTDRTVFYAMGGGQPGDTGLVRFDGKETRIVDTRKDRESGTIFHYVEEGAELPAINAKVVLEIDWARRHRMMRMHSCMHLLSAIIVAPVTGGQINDGRGRLDFDLGNVLDKEELTSSLNELIQKGIPREYEWITTEELDAQPELVKTMAVQPPRISGKVRLVNFSGVDLQPCGGTHVANSNEIGPVRVDKIENKGRHNRRVTIVFDE